MEQPFSLNRNVRNGRNGNNGYRIEGPLAEQCIPLGIR